MQRVEDREFAALMAEATRLMETRGWTWLTAMAVAEATPKPKRKRKGLSVWQRLASEATKDVR